MAARLAIGGAAVAGAVGGAAPAWAQAAGYYATPSLSAGEEYRSNIFEASKSPKGDFVTQITPGLSLGYLSQPFTLLGSYRLTSEIYARESDLTTAVARQVGSLTLRYSPDRRLTLRLDGAYTDTNDASEFLQPFTPALATPTAGAPGGPPPAAGAGTTPPSAGGPAGTPGGAPAPGGAGTAPAPGTPGGPSIVPTVNPGRQHGSVISAGAGGSYALDPRTSLDAGYTYTRTRLSGSPDDQSHQGSLQASRQFTPQDRGSLTYHLAVFQGTSAQPGLTTNSGLVGWTRQFTERLSASAEIGPRFESDGGVGVDGSASVTYAFAQGSAGLAYHHGAGLAVGRSGAQLVDTGTVSVTYRPLRELTLAVVGGVTRTDTLGSSSPPPGATATGTAAEGTGGSADAATPPSPTTGTLGSVDTVYSAGISASYQLAASLALRAYYQFSHDVQSGRDDIDDHVVGISLDWSYPFRLD